MYSYLPVTNAWQKQNENAEYEFKKDTTAFAFTRDTLIKSNKKLSAYSDSVGRYADSVKNHADSVMGRIRYYDSLNNVYQKKGLTDNQKINLLIQQNSNLIAFHRQYVDSIFKRNKVIFPKLDSLEKLAKFRDDQYMRNSWEIERLQGGNTTNQYEIRLLRDSINKLNARLH